MKTEHVLLKMYPQRVFISNTLSSQRDKIQFHDSTWPRIFGLCRELIFNTCIEKSKELCAITTSYTMNYIKYTISNSFQTRVNKNDVF